MKILFYVILLAQMMGHAPPVPMTPQQFAQSAPGHSVQIAVRVTRVQRTTIVGELLMHQSDTVSRATGKSVTFYFPSGTPVMMGATGDIVPGAVLYVYGILTKPNNVDIKRVVVDTKYVKVE